MITDGEMLCYFDGSTWASLLVSGHMNLEINVKELGKNCFLILSGEARVLCGGMNLSFK